MPSSKPPTRDSSLRRSVAGNRTAKPRMVVIVLMLVAWALAILLKPVEVQLEGKPAHHTNLGFRNVHITDPNKSFFSFLRLRMFGDDIWADPLETAAQVPRTQIDLEKLRRPGSEPQITWLGHSTFLIQVDGINILTDPIFSDRASPVSFGGPKRYTPHALDYALLPAIDYVIISHNHYDHLDKTAVTLLANQAQYLVPLGLKTWLVKNGINPSNVQELDWWQDADQTRLRTDIGFQAQPSQHWSARDFFDRRATLWASWLVQVGEFRFWFAGDTGYNAKTFKEIGERNGPIDLALIPIGAYAPRSFMGTYHVNPSEAVKIHADVQAALSIGMHWGTYPLTAESPMDPITKLAAARTKAGLGLDQFSTMAIGETRVLR